MIKFGARVGVGIRAVAPLIAGAMSGLLIAACGNSSTSTDRYWNVVMAGASTATITFGSGVANAVVAGTTIGFGSANIFASGGSAGCSISNGGTVVAAGASSGTIRFNNNCTGGLTSNLVIMLGSTVGILDNSNNYIVEPGKSATGTVTPLGLSGASTGNVPY